MESRADIDTEDPGRISVITDFRLKDQIKAVPGARWDSNRRVWTVPLSWPSAIAMRSELGPDLVLGETLMEWAVAEKDRKAWLRSMRSQLDTATPDDIMKLPGFSDLYPYQRVAAAIMDNCLGYLITDETGTGKSRSALAALSQTLYRMGLWFPYDHEGADAWGFDDKFPPTLITAPKSMLKTWAREIQGFFPGADVRVITGTPTKVKAALEPGAHFYIINYELLGKYSRVASWGSIKMKDGQNVDKEIQALGIQAFIADEAHRVKSPKSVQTRALWAAGSKAWFRLAMTGSPVQDTPMDLWPLLRLIAPHEYPTKSAFEERYLNVEISPWGAREITGIKESMREEFFSNLDSRMRRVTKEVALPFLPPKIKEVRWVTLPPKLRKAYADMAKDLEAEVAGGTKLTADSVMQKANRLIQLANSSGTVEEWLETNDEGLEIVRQKFNMEDPSPKIDAFIADVKEGDYDDQSVVIYTDSRQLADLLITRMAKEKLGCVHITGDDDAEEREVAMDLFQSGSVPFIVITRAGGTGITLTRASTMCRLMRSWSLTDHEQAEDRIHRIGSEIHERVTFVDYITEDTVEEGQIIRLNAKEARAQEVLRDDELLAMVRGEDIWSSSRAADLDGDEGGV